MSPIFKTFNLNKRKKSTNDKMKLKLINIFILKQKTKLKRAEYLKKNTYTESFAPFSISFHGELLAWFLVHMYPYI
jgi:hypothetical protein